MLSIPVFAILGASAVLALPNPLDDLIEIAERTCGTYIDSDSLEHHFAGGEVKQVNPDMFTSAGGHDIRLHFHVISKDETLRGGNIPLSQITQQVKIMNDKYRPAGFTFKLDHADITRTISPDWFNKVGPGTREQLDMKKTLRRGGCGDLNIYSVGFTQGPGAGLLGYATFPFQCAPDQTSDGVVLHYNSLHGGKFKHFNLGMTAVHEIGHWLSLLHTFEGGCSGPGDYISDTPASADPTSGCPSDRHSCPNAPGLDPVHNYMDYSHDSCMDTFTRGQIDRMISQFERYRM